MATFNTRDILTGYPTVQIMEGDTQAFANTLLEIVDIPAQMIVLQVKCESAMQAWQVLSKKPNA